MPEHYYSGMVAPEKQYFGMTCRSATTPTSRHSGNRNHAGVVLLRHGCAGVLILRHANQRGIIALWHIMPEHYFSGATMPECCYSGAAMPECYHSGMVAPEENGR